MDLHDEYILERAGEIQWTYIHRVCGEISVSRSIGEPPVPPPRVVVLTSLR
jgi:hypothetical protein